ncbi:MAG: GNAT family N-acetyltransferase [Chitinophagaceae bacterium]|nr:GNAT family N-acetyltransferase [Chitinophagaceae bacterium]
MQIRECTVYDIPEIQVIRNLVKENKLSNPNLVTNKDCELFITEKGKGWVCEINNSIVGFAIVDLLDKNIWALFMHPNFEAKGFGKQLQQAMLDWYFSKTKETIWLGTEPGTRAEEFYTRTGWEKVGVVNNGETKFEMAYTNWLNRNN